MVSIYFIDGVNGLDTNDGTAAATGGGHGPVATIAKCIGASGLAGSGDTVYIAPGRYNADVTVGVTPVSELQIIGDVGHSQAWAASTPYGPIIWGDWTTNDYTIGAAGNLLNLNGKGYLTFQDIWFVSGGGVCVLATTVGSTHLTFRRCVLEGRWESTNYSFSFQGTANVDPAILIEQCICVGAERNLLFTLPKHSATYTATVEVRNCLFLGSSNGSDYSVVFQSSGSGTGYPGGILVHHNTHFGRTNAVYCDPSYQPAGITVEGNLMFGSNNCVVTAGTGTNYASNYNRTISGGGIGVATAGANDVASSGNAYLFPPLFEFGQSFLWGLTPKPFLTPWPLSVHLGFGEGTQVSTVDLLNRPRPAGADRSGFTTAATTGTAAGAQSSSTLGDSGAAWGTNAYAGYIVTITGGTGSGQRRWVKSNTGTVLTIAPNWTTTPVAASSTYSVDPPGTLKAVGCFEYHDSGGAGGAANADGATGNCIQLIGPADLDLYVVVPASATVITVKVSWDSLHGDTNKPRAILLGNAAIGIAATEDATLNWHESQTAVGTAGSGYETLTFSSITPTAKGVVRLRLQSRAASGNGSSFWDSIGVS